MLMSKRKNSESSLVAMQDVAAGREVKDDRAASDHLLQDLGVREVSRDAVVHVEDEVSDLRAACSLDRRVEDRAKLRPLR
jgi:hypothetical protein